MLKIVLSSYRTGSSAFTNMLLSPGGTNHGELFPVEHNPTMEERINYTKGWPDDVFDIIKDDDIIKIQADTIQKYPEVLDQLESRFDCEYHLLYRKDVFAQAFSWTKSILAQEQFKDIKRKILRPGDEPNGMWFHTDYHRKLIFDWNDENAVKIFDSKLETAMEHIGVLSRYNGKGRLNTYEALFPDEGRLKQPYIMKGRMPAGSYLFARWVTSKKKYARFPVELNVPAECIPLEFVK